MSDTHRNSVTGANEKKAKPGASEGDRALAEGSVVMNSAAFQAFFTSPTGETGDAWTVARLAGVQGAKQADALVFDRHSLNVAAIKMSHTTDEDARRVTVRCEVRTVERSGAETSALVGCGIALMALMNILRVVDREMRIEQLRIVQEDRQ